ncbi:MAG: hypothetical protein SGI97_01730 [candidate division Zixibacteria bacterium]|nr:hypothetical protein [candidate division Zixibacteria bacterium]
MRKSIIKTLLLGCCALLFVGTVNGADTKKSTSKPKPVSVVAPVESSPRTGSSTSTAVALVPVTSTPPVTAVENGSGTPSIFRSASQTGEQIKWQVISSGGNRGTSPSYILSSTVGQTAVGPSTSPSFKLNSGFWQNFGPASCCINLTGNTDGSLDDLVDISDLTALIDHLFIALTPLACDPEGNTDGSIDGLVDISDLTNMIDHLFISLAPTATCM